MLCFWFLHTSNFVHSNSYSSTDDPKPHPPANPRDTGKTDLTGIS